MADETGEILDVAIIGGGVGGVYSGMRLLEGPRAADSPLGQGPLSVTVFEMSNRIGGRLLSLRPPGIPDTRVEVGGMRYTSQHNYVIDLVKKFNLTPVDFPVRDPQNFVYVRGELLRNSDLTDAAKLPYQLKPDESDPQTLGMGFTALAAIRLLQEMTGENWSAENLGNADWYKISHTYQFEGNYIWDLPFRYLSERVVSHEAFQFNMDTSGYDSILFTWNGADGFPWNLEDFGTTTTYSRLQEGYQQVPLRCAEAFAALGGKIVMGTRMEGFDCVTLPDGTPGVEFVTVTQGDNKEVHKQVTRARRLVLAMPRRSLELLEARGQVMAPANNAVRDLIESVTPIPLFKLALCYETAWWENLPVPPGMRPITSGETVTDLPVRQLYYWAKDEITGKAVVLLYDDGLALDYWAGLRSHEVPFKGDPGGSGGNGLPDWRDFPAPARMVEEVHRQILEMHGKAGDPAIPPPYAAAYHDWGDDPYGGGANFWHVGSQSYAVSKKIVQPMPGLPVYIVGESYSHQQGWVEGALKTAEDMLLNHLGVLPSPWQST